MTDGGHYFLGVEDVLDELERFWFDPQQVRVNLSAGKHYRVVFRRRHLIQRLIDLHWPAPVFFVPSLDFAGHQGDDLDSSSGFLEAIARYFQFRLLEPVGCQYRNFLALEIHENVSCEYSTPVNRQWKTSFRSANSTRHCGG